MMIYFGEKSNVCINKKWWQNGGRKAFVAGTSPRPAVSPPRPPRLKAFCCWACCLPLRTSRVPCHRCAGMDPGQMQQMQMQMGGGQQMGGQQMGGQMGGGTVPHRQSAKLVNPRKSCGVRRKVCASVGTLCFVHRLPQLGSQTSWRARPHPRLSL